MAWAEQLPSGRWRGRYRVRGRQYILEHADGSPWTFTSKAPAIREANAAEHDKRLPGAVLPGSGQITWGDWFEMWWPARRKTLEPNSIATYIPKFNLHIRPRWEHEALDDIEQPHVQDWVTGLPLAPSTAIQCYTLFAASMAAAVVAKKLTGTPCVDIDLPVPAPSVIRFLTRGEFDQVLKFLAGTWRMLVIVLAGTGMRWGEGVALHWQDVDLDRGTVRIHQAFSKAGREIKPFPKGRKARVVPLADWAVVELRTWRATLVAVEECGAKHRLAGRCQSGLVLPNGSGGCLSYTSCESHVELAVAHAKIRHATMHNLRDTFASWVLQGGRSIEQVAELLGDRDISLVRERYAEFADSQFDEVRSALHRESAPILPHAADPNIIDLASRRRSHALQKGDHSESV